MKTTLNFLLTAALMTAAHMGYTQNDKVEFGAKAAVQLSDIQVNGLDLGFNLLDPQMTPGVSAGLYSEIPMGKQFYFTPEFNYTQKGFKIAETVNVDVFGASIPIGAEAITRLHYLEMPLLMKYKFGSGATRGYVKAGPTLGYAVDGNVTTRINSVLDFDVAKVPIDLHGSFYNAFEVGAVAGIGMEWYNKHGKLFVDASFQHGLTDMINEPVVDIRVKNQALSFGLGYALMF